MEPLHRLENTKGGLLITQKASTEYKDLKNKVFYNSILIVIVSLSKEKKWVFGTF